MSPAGLGSILTFFFRPEGRITRLEYALGIGLILAINLAVLAFLFTRDDIAAGFLVIVFVLGIPFVVAQFVLVAKRCHDIGLPGSYALLLVVPLIGVVWLLSLAFIPGTAGPNAYGPAPDFRS